MSVFNPGTPNLSSSYANIQDALNKRADIAGKDSGGMGAAAAIAAPIADEAALQRKAERDKQQLAFQASLQDQLNKNASEYKNAGEGKVFHTQDDINAELAKEHPELDPKYYPKVGKGIWISPEEKDKIANRALNAVHTETLAQQAENEGNKTLAAYIRRANTAEKDSSKAEETISEELFPDIAQRKLDAKTRPAKTKDSFGRDVLVYPDGTTKVLNGAVKEVPEGQVAKSQSNLRPTETKVFNQGVKDVQKGTKETKSTFDSLDKLESDVDSKNPVSFFNDKIALVRLGGITAGRIAQGQIVQEAGARDFISKMQQKLETLSSGDWTPENRALIKKYIGTLRKVETEHLQNSIENSANTVLSQMPDPQRIDPEFVKSEFSKGFESYLPKSFDTVEEAEAANLKPGTRVKIKGQWATVSK